MINCGTKASAGCIRLTVKDAKWIYDNVARGTSVEFYSDENPGPLGKPNSQKISGNEANRGWDPTDQADGNPWENNVVEEPKEPQQSIGNNVNGTTNTTTNTIGNTITNNNVNNITTNDTVNNTITNNVQTNNAVNNIITNNVQTNNAVNNIITNSVQTNNNVEIPM